MRSFLNRLRGYGRGARHWSSHRQTVGGDGRDLVLTARDEARLNKVAQEIEQAGGRAEVRHST